MFLKTDQLIYLATSIFKRPAARWIVRHLDKIFLAWAIFVGVSVIRILVWGLFMDTPHYGFGASMLETSAYGIWRDPILGKLIDMVVIVYHAAIVPTLAIASPFLILAFPFVVMAASLVGVLFLTGSILLFIASPFLIIFSIRAVATWLAGKYLAASDQRERTEAAVKAALGFDGAAMRSIDGKARIMDAGEFAKLRDLPKSGRGIILGLVGGHGFSFATEKHVLVCASTRGGKGVSLIIPNLLVYHGSVFVLDPKGENAKETHEARRDLGPVKVLDPFGVSGLPSARFNPLATLCGDMMVTDAQMMADALIEGKEDHWTSSARGLLTGLILHVATAQGLPARDLPTVRTLLMRELPETLEAMTHNEAAPQEVRDVGAWGMGAAEDEWSSIVSTAIEQTKWLASPQIAEVLRSGGDQVDFAAYRDSVQSVYVCLPAPYFRTFSKWLRLVVAASLDTLTKQLNPDMPFPTRFVLDELAQLGTLEKVESALTLSAGYGVQLWGIWQHLKDMERCYPRSGIAGWMSSSGIRLVFATQDNESVRYFAGMCGGAMTETDIRHMGPDHMLCLIDGQNPVIVKRVPYFEYWKKPKAGENPEAPAVASDAA